MRRISIVASTLVGVVALALPASAKVPAEVYIEGEGFDVQLPGDESFEYAELSGLSGVRTRMPEPSGGLGARYTVRFVLRFDTIGEDRRPHEVVQYLYPYAQPEPMIYTPPGQRFAPGPLAGRVRAGWAQAEPLFVEWLEQRGLPKPPVEEPVATGARVVPTNDGVPWAILALGGMLLLSGAAGLVSRRGRFA